MTRGQVFGLAVKIPTALVAVPQFNSWFQHPANGDPGKQQSWLKPWFLSPTFPDPGLSPGPAAAGSGADDQRMEIFSFSLLLIEINTFFKISY